MTRSFTAEGGCPVQQEELDFQTAYEGLLKALGPRMTPRLQARLKEQGVDLSVPLAPAYPRLVFSRCCALCAEELYPRLPPEEGLRQVGHDFVAGYVETLVGGALMRLMGVLGVQRALAQLTRTFRSGDNYTDTRMTPTGERQAEVWLSQVNGQPTFAQGILERGLLAIGARAPRVRVLRREGEGCVYQVEWGVEQAPRRTAQPPPPSP
jgi:uncharacterized protein (TIGR02265 family)